MNFRSGLVEYFNGSSTVKNFNPGLQSAPAGTDRESRPYQADTTSKNYIKTATSKPLLLVNQLSSRPSGFCMTLSPGITVLSPLSKDMTGHKGQKKLDQ